jgi:hypothetical protein
MSTFAIYASSARMATLISYASDYNPSARVDIEYDFGNTCMQVTDLRCQEG